MKIGLSFSRCIRDIVEGQVNIDDILVIIARTDFNPTIEDQWQGIWIGYTESGGFSNAEWVGLDHDKTKEVVLKIWSKGLLHQPRKFGAYPSRRPEFWLEAVLPSQELEKNIAAKKAWNHFQTVAGLTNVNLDKNYE
jgi:hypothetical protein